MGEHASKGPDSGAIAIVGVGSRFPKAKNTHAFWENIAQGRACFSEVPRDRWDNRFFHNPNQRAVDKTWTQSGSFIENIREFPALHFGIAPRRLEVMDPQHRLLIEATRWALQDAGYEKRAFDRDRTGVFIGISVSEFKNMVQTQLHTMRMASGNFGRGVESQEEWDLLMQMTGKVPPIRAFSLSGSLTALAAASVSQTFDLGGPAYSIDAACASALVSVNDAVVQLRAGLVDHAIAGGVYVNLSPDNLVCFTRIGAISPSGVCRPFDARSNGFVQSDGVGIVVLKRLEDAQRDNDRIYALIRGSGCNNDGRGKGPMAPQVQGQLRVLKKAYKDAGCSPASVAYFEAHGTATSVGDPVEVEALGTLLKEADVPHSDRRLLGSVKGNIGHAMAAAGIAGLIKAIKVLEHRVAPPMVDFVEPNPALQLDKWPLKIASEASPLAPQNQEPLRVGVSSFGFGGTNAHIVLEEPPSRSSSGVQVRVDAALETHSTLPEAVVVTAASVPLLKTHLRELADEIEEGPLKDVGLESLAYTLNARRSFERIRAVVGAKTRQDLILKLRETERLLDDGVAHSPEAAQFPQRLLPNALVYDVGPEVRRPKLVFLFPGQGAQKLGSLGAIRERFSTFRKTFQSLDKSCQEIVPRSLSKALYPDEKSASTGRAALEKKLQATELCQPAMAALGLSMAELLKSVGVTADVSLGHSLGEFIALANAGSIQKEDAVRLVAKRGAAMAKLDLADPGTMIAAATDRASAQAAIEGLEDVWLANVNHPKQVTLSGTKEGIQAAIKRLREQGIDARPLKVSHAFHSPLLAPVRKKIGKLLQKIDIEAPTHVVASCIQDQPYTPQGQDDIRLTLKAHATAPVEFVRGITRAQEAGGEVFVQVGSSNTLLSFCQKTLGRDAHPCVALSLRDDDQGYEFLKGLCTLAALGAPVDFDAVYEGENRRVVSLPETPVERSEYWLLKDAPQPRPTPEQELPRSAPKMTEQNGSQKSPELVALFSAQAKILSSHAEIIALQNKLLLGHHSKENRAAIETKISEIMAETTRAEPPSAKAAVATAPTPPSEPAKPAVVDGPKAQNIKPTEPVVPVTPEPAVKTFAIREKILEIVARVSAFPKDQLRDEQALVDELGFDSLMVADLSGAIEQAFPNLGGIPPGLFSMDTTVGDLANHVFNTVGDGENQEPTPKGDTEPSTESSPITHYRVVAEETVASAPSDKSLKGETWLVTEDASELSLQISQRLEEQGARLIRVRCTKEGVAAPDRIAFGPVNLWPEVFLDGLPKALSSAGIVLDGFVHASNVSNHGRALNPVLTLHPIVSNLRVPRCFIITALGGKMGLEAASLVPENILQATLSGYTKSLAKERPHDIIRALDIDPRQSPENNADWIAQELVSLDTPPELGLWQGRRFIPELQPVEASATHQTRTLNKEDVVLITGGSGQIGQWVAEHLGAQKPKALVLMGTRQEDEPISACLETLQSYGVSATYVAAKIQDADSFGQVLERVQAQTGRITVAIHAAGLVDDAPAARKSAASIERVMKVKLVGAQTLLAKLPALKDLILFSSWAGRFGNAGQTDYAAANQFLDCLALSSSARPRVASIAFPPWASTRMVAGIPANIQSAMKAEGVCFLSNQEGVQAFDAVFSGNRSGIDLVGRKMPRRELRAKQDTLFSRVQHPYLEDHQLKGRPVVPLASAVDLAAWTYTETAQAPGALVITEFELRRGIFGEESVRTELQGQEGLDGTTKVASKLTVQDSASGRKTLAYKAQFSNQALGKLERTVTLGGTEESNHVDLDKFYRDHTFHGPMLRGIERIDRITSQGIQGLVRTSKLQEWIPLSSRSGWTIDPLVLDGSFQLAACWVHLHHGKAGYPIGFDRLTLLRPFQDRPVRATVLLKDFDDKTFAGDILYEDEEGQAYGLLENVRGLFQEVQSSAETRPAGPVSTPANGRANGHKNGTEQKTADIPKEHWEIEHFPEVETLGQRFQMAELMGLGNPFFHVHEGTAKNTSRVNGAELLNYSSYNYLGFSGHPEVVAAAQEATERFGTSVSASRIASGERPIHRQLEKGLAEHIGVDDAIVFVSGHATNVTTIGHLFDQKDLIIHDSLIHDSILQGIYLSGATRRPYPHGNLDALVDTLEQLRNRYRRVLICAEGIYSMDGDLCDLPRLIEIKKRFKALLLIDEAHSIGVLGPKGQGVAHHFSGLDPRDVDLWMGTLSKSFASCGGYIAGQSALVRYLKYTAPGFVYSAGITPANCAAALKSLELMHRQPEVVEQLRARSRFFLDLAKAKGIDTGLAMGAAVVPAIVGNSLECMQLSERLAARGINVQPIVYPAVEDNASRLRFFISALHTEDQLRHTVDVLVEELAKVRSNSGTDAPAISV